MLARPRARYGMLVAFLGSVFLLGGGSRADILSLPLLRPIAILVGAYALMVASRAELRRVRPLLILIGLLAALIAAHAIPLPPAIWQSLPDRELYGEIYAAAGIDLPWLPISTSPSRAWNALFAVSVPLAAVLIFAVQDEKFAPRVIPTVLCCIVISAAVGALQLLGSANSPLYLYRVTNPGLPVGLFANRNHQAVMLALGIVMAAYVASRAMSEARISPIQLVAAGGAILLQTLLLLITGSRAGLAAGGLMILVSAFLIYQTASTRFARAGKSIWTDATFRWAAVASCGAVVILIVATVLYSRSLAFDRLVGKDMGVDLRLAVLPTLLDLWKQNFLLGIGFGSFETAFYRVEPLSLLRPPYLNHAHNDWLEFVLEGGVPAMLLLALAIGWLVHAVVKLGNIGEARVKQERVVAISIIFLFAAASIVDYPLRVPSVAAVFAIGCGLLTRARRAQ